MLETKIRAVYEEMAATAQPPPRISIPAAHRRGRTRLRWRWAGAIGAPVFAAAAVTAIAVSAIPASGRGAAPPRHAAPAAQQAHAAPKRFNLLVPYASFSRLPADESVATGGDTATSDYLNLYSGTHFRWQLTLFAAGACQQAASTVSCSLGGSASQSFPLAARAPAVHGHPAFWAGYCNSQCLIWQYAPGAWVELTNASARAQSDRTVIQTASDARFGSSTQPIKFAVQLSSMPPGWYLQSVFFVHKRGALLATEYNFCDAYSASCVPLIFTVSAGKSVAVGGVDGIGVPDHCQVLPPDSLTEYVVIHGFRVTASQNLGFPPQENACTADADGLWVDIGVTSSHPAITPVALFRRMRLLGSDPAGWVTEPVG
jgi:hypothetical protein